MSQLGGHIASWWTKGNKQQSADGVVAHTPDPTKYHLPDGRQGDRMGSGVWGMMGAVIPRHRPDGSSRGFDPNQTSPILVDPNSPLGDGVVFDPSLLNNADTQQALASVGNQVGYGRDTDDETWTVIQMLSKPIKKANDVELLPDYLVNSTPEQEGPVATNQNFQARNSLLPNAYVTPRSDSEGRQAPTAGQPQTYQQMQQLFQQNKKRLQKHAAAPQAPEPVQQAAVEQPRRRRVEHLPPVQHAGPVLDNNQPGPDDFDDPDFVPGGASMPATRRSVQPASAEPIYEEEPQPEQFEVQPIMTQQNQPAQAIQMDPNMAMAMLQGLVASAMAGQQQTPAPPVQQPARRAGPVTPGRSAIPVDRRVVNPVQRLRPRQQAVEVPPPPQAGQEIDTAWDEQQEQEAQYEENPMLSLHIPFLQGAEASRPTVSAMIQLPGYGAMNVRFHAVIEGAGCVILVYDTRYEGGQQWAPPVTGDTFFSLSLPKLKKSYQVCSMGLQFNMGCLDFVVLVLPDNKDQGVEAE